MLMPDDRSHDGDFDEASTSPRTEVDDSWWKRVRLRALYALLRLMRQGDGRR